MVISFSISSFCGKPDEEEEEVEAEKEEEEEKEEEVIKGMGRYACFEIVNLVPTIISPEGGIVIATPSPGLMVKKPS